MRSVVIIGAACLLAACGTTREASTQPPRHATPTEPMPVPVADPTPARQETPTAPESPPPRLRELFPHVRADVAARLVELDGVVPIDCHHPETPVVYLEVTVCTPDTKEHEALVVTKARPSHVHAALLAVGFTPGAPGRWTWDGKSLQAIAPTGDALDVSVAYRGTDGTEIETPVTRWVINADPKGPAFGVAAGSRFVFSGSAMVMREGREWYDADGSGLLIGLTTFGSEAIAWSEVISHDATITEPEWIADPKVVPKFGTPVVVRIRPAR